MMTLLQTHAKRAPFVLGASLLEALEGSVEASLPGIPTMDTHIAGHKTASAPCRLVAIHNARCPEDDWLIVSHLTL